MNRERIKLEKGAIITKELDSNILIENIRLQFETPVSMRYKTFSVKLSSEGEIPFTASTPVLIEEPIRIVMFDSSDPSFRGWRVTKIEIDPMQVDDSEVALTILDNEP
jgi:hypothetical protein